MKELTNAHARRLQLLQDATEAEALFLRGPRARTDDMESAIRIFLEFLRGYESLNIEGPCVTVFGSARFAQDHPYCQLARELGQRLAQEGFAVMTGGGPGIMEAANHGAKDGGGFSIGCGITLPRMEPTNPYLDLHVEFDHFFVRKVMLIKYSSAFVLMPGGFGTLDEMFEALTLVQTGKIRSFPVIALGHDYWHNMRTFFDDALLANQTISPPDVGLVKFANTVDETLQHIRQGIDHLYRPAETS